jgi:hypothetical protein
MSVGKEEVKKLAIVKNVLLDSISGFRTVAVTIEYFLNPKSETLCTFGGIDIFLCADSLGGVSTVSGAERDHATQCLPSLLF